MSDSTEIYFRSEELFDGTVVTEAVCEDRSLGLSLTLDFEEDKCITEQ